MTNTAHDRDPSAMRFTPCTWQRATDARPYRTCSYCGSIHPTDLLGLLLSGDRVTLADESQGWPHKFYTEDYVKFYSLHMIDAGEDFEELAVHLSQTGIMFERRGDALYYRRAKGPS